MNPFIETARATALGILKPSKRDLEYGLELHRRSFVAESYSLGLHAPPDSGLLNKALEAGASDGEFRDLTENGIMTGWLSTPELRREYQEAWEAAGVSCLFLNAGEEGNTPLRLLKRLARYTYLNDMMPEVLARVASPREIEEAHKAGKRCLYLTLNGIPLAGSQSSVQDELSHLSVFAQLGVRMMHLTYNRRNPVGDGCGEPCDGGLSDFGRSAVAEMNRLGVIIDLAHTGWKTMLDVTRVSTKPVIVSHSTAHALCSHIRAKPDDVIRAVLDTGGTMGITNVPAFLGGDGDIGAFLDHIDYTVKKFGADAVTIGTDRAYKAENLDAETAKINPHRPGRTAWEKLWAPQDAINSDHWRQPRQVQSLAWTNWPLFTVGMVQRGHSDETIQKIVGGNLMRVARGVWEGSALANGQA